MRDLCGIALELGPQIDHREIAPADRGETAEPKVIAAFMRDHLDASAEIAAHKSYCRIQDEILACHAKRQVFAGLIDGQFVRYSPHGSLIGTD